jgi:hypothetical protein
MRTARQHSIDRAVARLLNNCGDWLLPQERLVDEVGLVITAPRATRGEVEESIRHLEAERRILGVPNEVTVQWKLTAMGRAWWMEVE